jgi:hypothetical protein
VTHAVSTVVNNWCIISGYISLNHQALISNTSEVRPKFSVISLVASGLEREKCLVQVVRFVLSVACQHVGLSQCAELPNVFLMEKESRLLCFETAAEVRLSVFRVHFRIG